jgi:hypothetical protein
MKSKVTSWILLPVVLGIWGTIGWKVYVSMRGDESNGPVIVKEELVQQKRNDRDSFVLLLNYRDPFLGKTDLHEAKKDRTVSNQPMKAEVKKTDLALKQWPAIRYSGLVKRTSDQKSVGFLNVDGRSEFVQTGMILGEIRIGKIWKDSVEVYWEKDRRVVRK